MQNYTQMKRKGAFPSNANRAVVIDTETTGLLNDDEIVEIAGVEVVDYKTTGLQYQSYIKTNRPMNEDARRVHHITDEMISKGRSIELALKNFLKFVGDACVIAHNAAFDIKLVNSELKKYLPGSSPISLKRVYCTQQMYQEIYPDAQISNMNVACERLGIDTSERVFHGALIDSKLCAELFIALHKVNLARIKGKNLMAQLKAQKKLPTALGERKRAPSVLSVLPMLSAPAVPSVPPVASALPVDSISTMPSVEPPPLCSLIDTCCIVFAPT
eukprot:TRINITY_DN11727_c0_g1_i2.p1 TRINITY_DN11727_c0_g1~~TRINITY_DN11727_c0_g1_i2.p1  ORF type:complete len:273 (-),score=63.44 TRINITY_DN11727_c0_g1_i2:109-927(-)